MDKRKKQILRNMGFHHMVDLVDAGKCPICTKEIDTKKFVDNRSKQEFEISGLCQGCQDELFTPWRYN